MSTEWTDGKPERYEPGTHYDVRLSTGKVRHVIGTAGDGPRYQDCRFAHEDTRLDQAKVTAWRVR